MSASKLAPRLQQDLATMLVRERDHLRHSLRGLVATQRALGESQGEESDAGGEAADVASDLVEQALGSGLARAELDRLSEVEAALERMSKGGYGVCAACDQEIDTERLFARPWARYCIGCARQREHHYESF